MPRLPKEHILRGYKAFAGVLSNGRAILCGSVRLFYLPVESPHRLRVGFSVSRTIRTAAVRNRVKRCLREAYRTRQQAVQALSLDMVLMYTGPVVRKSSRVDCKRIAFDVSGALQRLVERMQKQ